MDSEVDRYAASTPKSAELQAEAERYLPGGSSRGTAYFAPYPFFVERAEGHHVVDVDGNRYLDFMLNATTYVLGHSNDRVVEAVREQAANGLSYSTPHESQVRLAQALCERVPSVEKVRFTNSGTEGTLNAIRAARAYTGRHKIAKIEGGYHGNHEYVSVSVYAPLDALDPEEPTSVAEWPGQPPSVVEDVITLHYNDIESTERILRENAGDLSCVIIEPVLSNFGYLPADGEYLARLRELTTELGLIFIFDEVQSFRLSTGRRTGADGGHPRHDDVREGYWRWNAGGSLGRTRRPDGPVRPDGRAGGLARGDVQRQPDDDGGRPSDARSANAGGLRAHERAWRHDPREAEGGL